MSKFNWKNGTLVQNARVNVDGTMYDVEPAQFEGETPLSAENLNAMQDGIYEDIDATKEIINKSQHYSTAEHVVGTWETKNGAIKPIYRRRIYFTTGTHNVWQRLRFDDMDKVEEVTKLEGYFRRDNITPTPLVYYRDAQTYSVLIFDNTSGIGNYIYQPNGYLTGAEAFVIIEYTKTTD